MPRSSSIETTIDRDLGEIGVGLQRREHVPAVDPRQDDVEHDRRRAQVRAELEARAPSRATSTAKPASLRWSDSRSTECSSSSTTRIVGTSSIGRRALARRRRGRHQARIGRVGAQREREREGAPAADLALHPHPPAVQLDELARQRQAEPGALVAFGVAAALLERLEDPLLVLGGDPDPGVADRTSSSPVELRA